MIWLIACRTLWLGPTKLMDDSVANLPMCGDPQGGDSIGSTLHVLDVCSGSCLPVANLAYFKLSPSWCAQTQLNLYVTHTRCQKNTGTQVTIKNEMHCSVWLPWHICPCLCQQRNELGPTASPHLTLSAWPSSRSQHTSLVPTPPAAPACLLQELSDFALLPLA